MTTSLCQDQRQDKISALGHSVVLGIKDQRRDGNHRRWQEFNPQGRPQGQPSDLKGLICEMSFAVAFGGSDHWRQSCGASQGPSCVFFPPFLNQFYPKSMVKS